MWRRQLVAAFVLYHCVAISISALPNAGEGLNRTSWRDPTVQDEFARWAGWLGLPSDELQDRAFAVAKGAAAARVQVLRPFSTYLAFFGIKQAWKMFVAPHRYPTRFQLQSSTGGDWETRFFEADPAAQWNGAAMSTEPFRSQLFRWGWPAYARSYEVGCRRLAARIFAEEAGVERVRCRVWKYRTLTPLEAREGREVAGEWLYPILVER